MFDQSTIAARRERVATELHGVRAVVLFTSGAPIPKPGGLDQTYPFQPHPEYYWLTGSRRWGSLLALDPDDGWVHFVRPVDAAERLWEADVLPPPGRDAQELAAWLKQGNRNRIAVIGPPIPGLTSDNDLALQVQETVDCVRRIKDQAEIELLRDAARATAAGFRRAAEVIAPGASERAIQIEVEAEFFRQGADAVGYESIVAAGPHAAVLHSQPGDATVAADDLVLVDAGGAIRGYTADVTRTFPGAGQFTPEQQAIYDIVLAAETAGIRQCRSGVEWRDVHRTAAAELAAGLKELGILTVGVEASLDSEAIAMFFPHGVGHMVGLGVRDVGGRAPGRDAARRYCGARVRVDLPLQAGFVMTVEPGLYFVPALLDDSELRAKFRDSVAWDALERWRRVGGVRIEDNVLITDDEPQVLTADIPK